MRSGDEEEAWKDLRERVKKSRRDLGGIIMMLAAVVAAVDCEDGENVGDCNV